MNKVKISIYFNVLNGSTHGYVGAICPNKKYGHVFMIAGLHFYEGGYGSVTSPLQYKPKVNKERNHEVVLKVDRKELAKIHKRFNKLHVWERYSQGDHVRLLLKGYCKPSKKKERFACSCLIAYLLGIKKYWTYDADRLYRYLSKKQKG